MKKHLVSVVMPVYNEEKTVKRAIESVLSQTYNEIELLIIDDGSTDSTPPVSYTHLTLPTICSV